MVIVLHQLENSLAQVIIKFMSFFKSNKHLDSDSVVGKYKEQFVGKNEGHELEADPATIYNCLNKLYIKVTYNLRGKSRAEFLKKRFTKPRSKAAFLSEVLNESPRKVELRKELQQKRKSNLELKRKLDDSIEVIEELDNEIKLLTNEYETKINNMALLEQQYDDVITKVLNDRNPGGGGGTQAFL